MPSQIFEMNDHLGKTIESWTSQYFDVREYWKITFTDGTILHVVSDSDYSDIHTDMRIIEDDKIQDYLYPDEEDDE